MEVMAKHKTCTIQSLASNFAGRSIPNL